MQNEEKLARKTEENTAAMEGETPAEISGMDIPEECRFAVPSHGQLICGPLIAAAEASEKLRKDTADFFKKIEGV